MIRSLDSLPFVALRREARALSWALSLAATLLSPLASSAPAQAPAQVPAHPLDGLSASEHWTVREALASAGKLGQGVSIAYVGLHEPPKGEVLAWTAGMPMRRQARAQLVSGDAGYEGVVDLSTKTVVQWERIPGVQWMQTAAEVEASTALVLEHPDFVAGLKKRGITDLTFVTCFPNAMSYMAQPEERGRRIARIECTNARGAVTGYGHAITDLLAVVDLVAMKVLRVIDNGPVRKIDDKGDWDTETLGPARPPLKPLVVSQPQGRSFTIDGSLVTWDNWSFRLRTDMRRGLVLSLVSYKEQGKERSVMYEGSLSELFVPYMAPDERWNYTAYFDLGTFTGIFEGVMGSLEPGIDCPAHGTLLDGVVAGWNGEPRQKPRLVCIYERAGGDPAWRHGTLWGIADGRARRDLVVRMVVQAQNYDYLFDWTFTEDGVIRVSTGATGIMQVKGVQARTAESADDRYGRYVSPELVAINHSHFASFRLDLDVDGKENSLVVERLRSERLPEGNPRKSIWRHFGSVAREEKDGRLMSMMTEPHVWRIVNPGAKGAAGDPVGYQIAVDHGAMSLMSPDDWMVKRAGFIDHTLWVTPYRREELFAAGDHPTLSTGGEGLPKWTAANRKIENTDLVAWVTVGFHHVPRLEDWPVMPLAWHHFEIRPNGFFARNPGLTVPK